MPELPDVEALKDYADAHAIGRTVADITSRDARALDHTTPQRLQQVLHGRRLTGTRRHGKHLFIRVGDKGPWLVMHFGMTGRLLYFRGAEPDARHNVVVLNFDDGGHLAYNNRRKLGRIGFTEDPDGYIRRRGLGPDALAAGESDFRALLAQRRGMAKNFLMDQHQLAGLGNVYSDEVLFDAGIQPRSTLQALSDADRRRLYRSMMKVLRKAVQVHADPGRLPRSYLVPHRREGEVCPRCGTPLAHQAAAGRTSYYCPHHQRLIR